MKKKSNPLGSLIFGLALSFVGFFMLLYGEEGFYWRGGFISPWISWFLLPIGIIITILSLRSFQQQGSQSKTYSDEEVAQSEAEMDAMYFREHGEMPQKPTKEE